MSLVYSGGYKNKNVRKSDSGLPSVASGRKDRLEQSVSSFCKSGNRCTYDSVLKKSPGPTCHLV